MKRLTFDIGREGREQIRGTVLFLVSAVSFVALISGLLVLASGDVARWVVEGIAWFKGVPLDAESYGLSRSVLWENQLRRLAPDVSTWGAAGCLCVMAALVLPRVGNPWTGAARGVMFLAAFFLAVLLVPSVRLPFSNPLGIVGPFEQLGQNPGNSTFQFLILLLIPAAVVLLFDLFHGGGERTAETLPASASHLPRTLTMLLVLGAAALVLLVTGDSYRWHAQVPLDTFHEGESLAPAVRWEQGQIPYRDFVIVHGPFQDPLRSVLAFNVFGRSIAAARTMESLLEIAALCLYALLVFHVFEWDSGRTALAAAGLFLFAGSKPFAAGFNIPHRDIPLFPFLFGMISLYRALRPGAPDARKVRTLGLLFLSSALPLAAFVYSTDRGLYLTAGAVITIPLLYWSCGRRIDASSLGAIAGGVAAGTLCLGLSIRWAFPEFLSYVFVVLPQFFGLGFALPYPFESATGLIPLALIAFNVSWTARSVLLCGIRERSFRRGAREFTEKNFVEVLLLVLGTAFYLSALGRADPAHIYYSGGLVFLLTALLLIRHIGGRTLAQVFAEHGVRVGLGVVLAVATVILYLIPGVHGAEWFRFPLGSPDREAIAPSYRPAVTYLRDSLSRTSQFVTLTSEGVWEYFLGRPSPTRFPIIVYALPKRYQEEVIDDMELHHVDYVLYRNNAGSNAIDGIPLERRMPGVMRYIGENYEPFREFEDQQLWKRRGE